MSRILLSVNYLRKISGIRLTSSLLQVTKIETRSWSMNTSLETIQYIAAVANNRNYVTNIAVKESTPKTYESIDQKLNEVDRIIKVHGCILKRQFDPLLEMIKANGTLTSREALFLIRCCGDFLLPENINVRIAFTNNVWGLIKKLNVPLDISHYNALLLVNLENETDFSPVDFLLELKTQNIEANRVTFQRLIEQYCKKGDIAGATKILEHMKEEEIPLNETIFSCLIRGHSEAGSILEAISMLNIMNQAGIEPTSLSYKEVLCAHAKRGDIEAINAILLECKEKKIEFFDKDILEIIYTLAIYKHWDYIDQIMAYLVKSTIYNKNAIQYIYKLIDKDQVKVAFKLVQSLVKSESFTNTENFNNSGSFFIRKLINSNMNIKIIIHYCNLMINNNINKIPFEVALFIALKQNLNHLALPLMRAWHKSGAIISENHFYPIFVAYSKNNNLEGLLECMKIMITQYKIRPNIRTISNYVIPYMTDNPMNDVKTLVANKLSVSTATNAMIIYLFNNNKMKQVAEFVPNINLNIKLFYAINELVQNLITTCDVKSYIRIICCYQNRISKQESSKNQNTADEIKFPKIIDVITIKAVKNLSKSNIHLIKEVFNEMLQMGISISEETSEEVKALLSENFDSEIESILSKLKSANLSPPPILKTTTKPDEQSNNESNFKMMLIQQNCDSNNFNAVEHLLKELEGNNTTYTIPFCRSLFNHFLKIKNLEKAERWFNEICKINQYHKFKKIYLLEYADLLILNNRIADAEKVLQFPLVDMESDRSKAIDKLIYNVSQKYPNQLEEFINLLQNSGFFKNVTVMHIKSLIKEPVLEGNMKKALENFKWAYKNYRLVPQKNELIQKFINSEDVESLQIITNILTEKYGQINALFNLALGFLECDRLQQAKKILQTPGMKFYDESINFVVDKYIQENRIEKAEKLISLLKGLYLNIDLLYMKLLKIYEKNNLPDKALKLWTQLQEDNIQPTESFMNTLNEIINKKNRNGSRDINFDLYTTKNFHNALISKNLSEAKNYLKDMSAETKNVYSIQLLKAYLDESSVQEALSFLNEIIDCKDYNLKVDSSKEILLLFDKLVESDDFQNILNLIFRFNNSQTKFPVHLIKKDLNLKYLNSGKYLMFLQHLDKLMDDPTFSNSDMIKIFDLDIAHRAMEQLPELREDFKKFALKAYDKQVSEPINVLWIYEFLRDSPNAENIWNEYFKGSVEPSYFQAMYICYEREAWDKLLDLTEKFESSSKPYDIKKKLYRTSLTLLLKSNCTTKYEMAFECLRKAVKTISIESFDQKLIQLIETNITNGQTIESLKEKDVNMDIQKQ